jgi:type I restriction enzyme, S subunit
MKKGWERKTIGDVCEFQRGLTYAKKDEVDISDNVVLRATNIDLTTNLLTFDELKYISDKVLVPDSKKVKRGSLMICTASGSKRHLGKVAFIDDDYDYAFGGFMGMLTPLNELLPKYLFHLMTSEDYKDFIGTLSDGVNINNLKFDDLRRFPIPVPPLAEQRRIVGILDEAFAGLATAQAHAEKNLQNARALFESHLNNVFSKKGEGWVEKPLTNLCEFFGDGDWVESKDQSSEGIRLVQTGNVGEGVFKDRAEKARYISEATFKRLRCTEIFEGDCLISRLPDPVGRSCILPNIGERMITAVDCTIVRFKRAQLFPKLFNLYSQSTGYIGAVAKQCTGTTRSRISRTNLGLIPVPVPPLPEQTRIIAHLDALSAETRRLAALYESKLSALAELKKSLLHRAFAGEL